jgi:transglutaminase-like putative cysteine protease
MRYTVKHITEYIYGDRVSHCYNLAHMIPRNTQRQVCLSTKMDISPLPAYKSKNEDYFGNFAYHFEIQKPHKKLTITAVSDIETRAQSSSFNLDFGVTCREARQLLSSSTRQDILFSKEFLLNTPMVSASEELREYAAPLFDDNRPLLSAVMALTSKIYTEFDYSPLATSVATPLSEVLKARKGVCQDFAHLQIACLRALGFPAKYISGYLETVPAQGQERLVGADATHAWIAVYSPTEGWFEFDPTNDCLAGEQHVVTAWGRDFFDVTPLKGVIFGGGDRPALRVSVDVARVE